MLDERKLRVLYAIIDHYIKTGQPIGSRTVARKYNFSVSPATIRNEMSDLEELGYLGKSHSSSGRIPSNKAYRYYVDSYLEEFFLERMNLNRILTIKEPVSRNEMKDLLELVTSLLVQWTQYTAVGSFGEIEEDQLEKIRVFPIEKALWMVMMIYPKNNFKNQILITNRKENESEMNELVKKINSIIFENKNIEEELSFLLDSEKKWHREFYELISQNLYLVDTRYILSGLGNILDFQEYQDTERAKEVLLFFEDDAALGQLFTNDNKSLVIKIGEENQEERLKDASVLTTSYLIGGQDGKIALIGPTRMDYHKAVQAIYLIGENLHSLLSGEEKGR